MPSAGDRLGESFGFMAYFLRWTGMAPVNRFLAADQALNIAPLNAAASFARIRAHAPLRLGRSAAPAYTPGKSSAARMAATISAAGFASVTMNRVPCAVEVPTMPARRRAN